jgi:hypothetical protein
LTLRDLFIKMLMTTRGVSAEKAVEIVKVFPTPRILLDAFQALKTEAARKNMVTDATSGNLIKRRRIGPALSERLWRAWHGVSPPVAIKKEEDKCKIPHAFRHDFDESDYPTALATPQRTVSEAEKVYWYCSMSRITQQ